MSKSVLRTAAGRDTRCAGTGACQPLGAKIIATVTGANALASLPGEHPGMSTVQLDWCDPRKIIDLAATVRPFAALLNMAFSIKGFAGRAACQTAKAAGRLEKSKLRLAPGSTEVVSGISKPEIIG